MEYKSNRRWFSIAEAAAYFNIKKKTLYSLAARGLLPKSTVLRLGKQIRVDIKAIEETAGNRNL